jgi:hypothetical protein
LLLGSRPLSELSVVRTRPLAGTCPLTGIVCFQELFVFRNRPLSGTVDRNLSVVNLAYRKRRRLSSFRVPREALNARRMEPSFVVQR